MGEDACVPAAIMIVPAAKDQIQAVLLSHASEAVTLSQTWANIGPYVSRYAQCSNGIPIGS